MQDSEDTELGRVRKTMKTKERFARETRGRGKNVSEGSGMEGEGGIPPSLKEQKCPQVVEKEEEGT